MKKFICFVFTVISFLNAASKPALILHFDVNKTLIAKDSVEKKNVEDVINVMLARTVISKWDENLDEKTTFSDYMKKVLLPGDKSDKKLKQKRVDMEAFFLNFLKEKNHPEFSKISEKFSEISKKLPQKGEIFTSFYKLIDYLENNKIDYKIVFRTFGTDLSQITAELKERFANINKIENAFFKNGKLLTTDNSYVIENYQDQYQFIKNQKKWFSLRDDWHYWMENSLHQNFGKRFFFSSENKNEISLFFDDNVKDQENNDENIVAPYDISKKSFVKVLDLIKKKRIFSVKPIDAILDENYFINFVKDAMSFDEKSS